MSEKKKTMLGGGPQAKARLRDRRIAAAVGQEPIQGPEEDPNQDTRSHEAEARACIEHIKSTGQRFEQALQLYHQLLEKQSEAEISIETAEQGIENKRSFDKIQAKAAKLLWASLRYGTSATITTTAAAAGTYALTGDPAMAALAAGAGVASGVAAEAALSLAESKFDRSEEYFRGHPATAVYMREKDLQAEADKSVGDQIHEKIIKLQASVAKIIEETNAVEAEIDALGSTGFALLRGEPATQGDTDMTEVTARLAVQELSDNLKAAGYRFDVLLADYREISALMEGAENYLDARGLAVIRRDVLIQAKVAGRKMIEVAKTVHMTLVTGGMAGMGSWMAYINYAIVANGAMEAPPEAAAIGIAGGAAGAALNWFLFSRIEKKIFNYNIPHGQYETRDRLAGDLDYQRFSDPAYQERKILTETARQQRDELFKEEHRLARELDEFMDRYPMTSEE